MSNYNEEKKEVKYWQNREEILMSKLRKAVIENNEPEMNRIFPKIRNKLRIMIESILMRYFQGQYNYHNTDTYVNDALTHCIMALPGFNEENKTRYYSYIGTIAKRYLFNQIVTGISGEYNKFGKGDSMINWEKDDNLIENLDNIAFPSCYEEEKQYNNSKEILFKYLDNLKKQYEKQHKESIKNNEGYKIKTYEKMLVCVNAMKETAEYFGNEGSAAERGDMVNYMIDKYDVSTYYLNKTFNTKLLGGTRNVYKNPPKYPNEMIDMDFTPDINIHLQQSKKTKILKYYENYEYLMPKEND